VRRPDAGILLRSSAFQFAYPDRDAPLRLVAGESLKQTGDGGRANTAVAIRSEPPGGDLKPISADDPLTAARAVRALARLVMDIPRVDEMQPDLASNIASRC
jgi:hypothetical protein